MTSLDIDVPRPDEKSVLTYVATLYQYFAKMKNEQTSGKRINKVTLFRSSPLCSFVEFTEKHLCRGLFFDKVY